VSTSSRDATRWERRLRPLGSPRVGLWIALVAALFVAPAVNIGFTADDHILAARIGDTSAFEGFAATRWDLFVFVSGDPSQRERLLAGGTFAWWVAPGYKLAFLRPLSSATHVLDFVLWPRVPALMMIHSIAWLVTLLTIVHAVLRRFHAPVVAGLALLLYAIDDARGPAVGYLSNRNALLMASFGLAALWAHDRARRDDWSPGRWLGPLSFGIGLLAGEGTVAVLAYLFAHACFVDPGDLRARVRAFVPYVGVLLAWAFVYKALGYGSHGSGIYVEPADDPLAFAVTALERIPVLLFGQLGGPWSDFWMGYPVDVARVVWVLAWIGLAVFAWWCRPLLRADPVARMWALGSVLACVPIAGTFPADRLLAIVGVGAMALVAQTLHGYLVGDRPGAAPVRRGGLARVVFAGLVLAHLVLAPLLLPIRSRSMVTVEESLAMFDAAVPDDPTITARTVVVVLAPNDGLVSYLPVTRAQQGRAAPARIRLLASATSSTLVERTGPRTLVVEPVGGLLSTPGERMLRSEHLPFTAGDTVALPDMRVVVETITADARPHRVRFEFASDLDDPSFLWLRWDVLGFVPWTPPAIGSREELAGFDMAATLSAALHRDRTR